MRLIHVVAARPNFMKAAPVYRACAARGHSQLLVHTGQHYDANMSDVFFQQLGLPHPDVNLEVGSGGHAEQTAKVMTRFEQVVRDNPADWVVVYGDVNSTLAAALVCAKLLVPVAHVEAGLRSGDRTMPEEVNRVVTDAVADLLFTPSEDGDANLLREGVAPEKVRRVGNVMIDTLLRFLPLADPSAGERYGGRYVLVTLHRPSNVDDPAVLAQVLGALRGAGARHRLPVVFPVHPRTRRTLPPGAADGLELIDPLGYLEFLALQRHATAVVTDSGGIQEETTFLGVPCLTVRQNTERPVTVTLGTNTLVGHDFARLGREIDAIVAGRPKAGRVPPLWDGRAAERIADVFGG
jgi:UDP-N-acetylglucosamine 2-epimerase (non-hydrolysing)